MKVLDLRCSNGHGFEGWFASEEEYRSQNGSGMLECPLCADKVISRLPSAPRLNLSGARESAQVAESQRPSSPSPPTPPPAATDADLHAVFMRAVRHVLANTEDVGPRFAEEARRIHYGESEARGIRGQASREEAEALIDEGVEIGVLPVPDVLKEPLQ
ncbi:MAG TPA: DUF1178 family protein [Burkholderiaceae bacterium]|nr:DUF1178 family protein [Burkholderiaceae bacterium]